MRNSNEHAARPRHWRMLAVPALVAALTACGGNGDDATGPDEAASLSLGTGSVTVSNGANHQFGGRADFWAKYEFGDEFEGFRLYLGPSNESAEFALRHPEAGRPDVGTYPISTSAQGFRASATVGMVIGVGGERFNAQSGELRITASSPQSLQGTATFQTSDGYTVNAAFNARCPSFAAYSCD